jgi:O-antigen ligase
VERAGVVVLAALAPLAMLAVDPSGWYPFGPVKWLVVSTVALAGSALVLAANPLRLSRPLALALLAFLAAMSLAAALGEDGVYAWTGTPERHLGVATWALCALLLVVGRTLEAPEPAHALVAGLLVAGAGVGGLATAEALGWEPDVFDVGSRLTATFGSAAYLGAATALLLPVAAGVLLQTGYPVGRRVVAGVATVLLAVAAAGSGARAAWVGLGAATVVAAWARRRRLRAMVRAGRPWSLLAGMGAIAVVVAVVALSPVGGRLGSVTDADAPGGRGRIDEWRIGTRVAVHHPLVGVGPEGYRIAFSAAVDAQYERAHGRAQQPDRAHSGPLDVMLAGGLLALVPWLAIVIIAGRSVWAALRRGPPWLVGVAAGLVAHLVGQLYFFPVVELEPVAWLLAGVVMATARTGARSVHRRRVPLLIPIAFAALVAVAAVAGTTDVAADHTAGRGARALARGDHRRAAIEAVAAADQRPDIVRLHLLAARALVADDQGIVAGLHQLDAALDVSPGDPIVLRTRASLLVDRARATRVPGQVREAVQELHRLLDDDPHNAALWDLLATASDLAGEPAAAARARATAEDLTPPGRR